jgi:apolipoprotein D and lipocalin family protein
MRRPAATLIAVALGTLLASASAMAAPDVRPLASVDLSRYAGRWFEIARYPNRFQKDCVGDTTAEYALRPDGRVTVTNRCRQANGSMKTAVGVARWREQPPRDATLKVRFAPAWLSFIPQVWGDYWIIALAPDYRYVVVGEPSRTYLWILSRTPTMSDADYQEAVAAAAANGYDTAKLVRTEQRGQDG